MSFDHELDNGMEVEVSYSYDRSDNTVEINCVKWRGLHITSELSNSEMSEIVHAAFEYERDYAVTATEMRRSA